MLVMAENHIKTNSMGLQCVVQRCYEQNAQSLTEPLSLYMRVTNTQSSIQDHKKQRSQKILKTAVQGPPHA